MKRIAALMLLGALALTVGCVATVVHGTVQGTVTDVTGAPLSGVKVEAQQGSTVYGQATTAADGSYRITGLEGGQYNLVASKTGYQDSTLSVDVVASGTTSGKNFVLEAVLEL